ncbi:MAG TPA: alcohol dehydrogenase catalytic domain-containing protein [Bryobacteraceae bacterium]|nr:alcohol dehydrogenase catalytic domain-containing protein [Bryobacteraceae bacterium]
MQAAHYLGNRTIQISECRTQTPGPNEVQLRVSHCGICGTDLHLFHGNMDHRVTFPQVIGHESSATIEALGANVQTWRPGDRVTVRPLAPCGQCAACQRGHSHVCQKLKFIGIDAPGAMQGLWTVPAHTLHALPPNLSLSDAALIEPIAVACHDVRLGETAPGEFAVVIGGGPIGALVALVARHKGARVIVTEINPFRIKLLQSLGLEVYDPRTTDIPALVQSETREAGADVVFEVSGAAAGAELMTKLGGVRSRIVMVAVFPKPVPVDLHKFFWREMRLIGTRVYEPQDFDEAIDLLANTAIPFSKLITNSYPLAGLEKGLLEMEQGADVMKILIDCQR